MSIFITACAIALILEGLVPALFPNRWRAYVSKLTEESSQTIRTIGTLIVLLGGLLLWGSIAF